MPELRPHRLTPDGVGVSAPAPLIHAPRRRTRYRSIEDQRSTDYMLDGKPENHNFECSLDNRGHCGKAIYPRTLEFDRFARMLAAQPVFSKMVGKI